MIHKIQISNLGMTLLELLVAITINLMVMTTVFYVWNTISKRVNYGTNQSLYKADLQRISTTVSTLIRQYPIIGDHGINRLSIYNLSDVKRKIHLKDEKLFLDDYSFPIQGKVLQFSSTLDGFNRENLKWEKLKISILTMNKIGNLDTIKLEFNVTRRIDSEN